MSGDACTDMDRRHLAVVAFSSRVCVESRLVPAYIDCACGSVGDVCVVFLHAAGNDTDQPKTVADRVADDNKARLLRRFNFGVMAYMISWFVATLLPLFLYSPGQEDIAVRVMLILENLARWAFLAVLCWVFRCAPTPSLPLSPSPSQGSPSPSPSPSPSAHLSLSRSLCTLLPSPWPVLGWAQVVVSSPWKSIVLCPSH
jgi:hypothetical protein